MAVALLAIGCGSGPSRRDEVTRYMARVNTIEAGLTGPASAVAVASRGLAKPQANAAETEAKLRRAASEIDRVHGRLAAVAAPVDARRLRTLLLTLAGRQAAIARELADIVAYLPALQAALRPLASAGTKLQKAIAGQSSVEAKASAFDAYSATVAKRLRSLHPPPVSRPGHTTEVTALTRVEAATEAIAKALRAKRTGDLAKLLRRFDQAALSTQSLSAQRARAQAVRAYNSRVRSLDTLIRRITDERARLAKTLP